MDVKDIKIEDFDYKLPEARIALFPLQDREDCKLLVGDRSGRAAHLHFRDMPNLLPENSVLFCNDTRVINARMEFFKSTGSRIEIFLLEPEYPEDYVQMFQSSGHCEWSCLVGNRKRWKSSPLEKKLIVRGREVTLRATLGGERNGNSWSVSFDWDDDSVIWSDIVEEAGAIPIPPYLNRESQESDSIDYQTVYARYSGSVAAPTAGLHFTDRLLDELKGRGVKLSTVTLHVGAGTFQPVKSEAIGDHPMHTEIFTISQEAVKDVIDCLEHDRKVVAVGTTTVRTLESLPYLGFHLLNGDMSMAVGQWEAYGGEDFDTLKALRGISQYMEETGLKTLTAATSIMIAPGFKWRIVNNIITNFHQPQSTLLLLVSSFLGGDRWRDYYREALDNDYRFLSYGDACLFKGDL